MNSFVKRVLQILAQEFFIKHIPLSFNLQFLKGTLHIYHYMSKILVNYMKKPVLPVLNQLVTATLHGSVLKGLRISFLSFFVSSLSCFLYSFRIIPEKLTSDNISVRNQLLKRWHLKRIWQIPTSNFSLYQCLVCCFFLKVGQPQKNITFSRTQYFSKTI